MTRLNELSYDVIGAAIEVHRSLGPGLLESAYEACLAYELAERGLAVERQKPLPLVYKGVKMKCGYRVDLFVEGTMVVEVKSINSIEPIHTAQLLSYLRLLNLRLGLLVNFNVEFLRQGIRRVLNGY